MGFFFSQQTKPKRGPSGPRIAQPTKQNAATLQRLGCAACPLDKADVCTPKMQPTLAPQTEVYFLAEAPNEYEDETSGKPLTGPAGKLLRNCIPDDAKRFCSFDSIIRDRPPNDRAPKWQEVECCRGNVTASIEKAKPKLIIGLGPAALNWAVGGGDIFGQRGRLFAVQIGKHACWFLPTFHPDFVIEKAYNKDKPLQSKLGNCFKLDIDKGLGLLDALKPPKIEAVASVRAAIQCFDGSGKAQALLALLRAAKAAPYKAIDLETSTLRPYAANARLLTAAISFDDTHFSFAIDHPKARWESKEHFLSLFKELLMDDTIKIAHNSPFEMEWLAMFFGKSVVRHDVWECSQMQAHMLDERRNGQSLDALVKQHFGISYKKLFDVNLADMAKTDLNEALIYNGADTKYGLKLWRRQHKLLKDMGLTDAYYEAIPRQASVALMQSIGICVDQKAVKTAQTKLTSSITQIEGEIDELKVIKAFKKDNKEFNHLSNDDVVKVFGDYLKRPEVRIEEEGKVRYSADKNILDQIDHPLAKLLISYRNVNKLRSTYVDCFELGKGKLIWPDGRIHPSFNTTFTETGRTSSDQPNQQNWPKRKDAWVRGQVAAPEGHVILAVDYGQLEACTSAICSRDKVLVKALWENYDIHMEWTEKLVHRYPLWLATGESMDDKATAKKYRSVVKNKLVFPAIFGAQNKSIAGYLKVPEDVIDDLMKEFWATFHGLKTWQDSLMRGYYNKGYVESPTGRRRYYPMTRNQAINDPIQSFACDIVCDAMNRLSKLASTTGQWHLHPIWNIHDDLGFYIPDNDDVLEAAIEQIKQIMLTPPYDFINVPLSIECSIGTNWYQMEDFAKFWSHKDLK